MPYKLTVKGHFDAAHYLRGYEGKCQRLHGHTFNYIVEIEGKVLNKLGILIDFVDIKAAMKMLEEDWLDHKDLNNVGPFMSKNPTAENLAEFIYKSLRSAFICLADVRISSVTVWESPDAGATFYE